MSIFTVFTTQNLKAAKALLLLPALFMMTSCDLAANYNKADRAANAETQDFRDAMAERLPDLDDEDGSASKEGAGGIPALEPYVSTDSSAMKPMPLVSVSVNQSVPLRDTLFELAEQAGYDIELDPRIKGAIIFTARNKPFDDVMRRICEMGGLRYKLNDDFIRVELDEPYNKIYKIDYLSMVRSNSGSVSTNVSVVSGEGADTGSTYSVNSESNNDFWAEMESNLKQILGGSSTGALKTKADPKISATQKNPESKKSDKEDASEDSDKKAEEDKATEADEDVVLTVDSLPVNAADEDEPVKGAKGKDGEGTFTINKQAGILSVYASERMHKQVEIYLKEVRRAITSQVLIEAKIFEVDLNDEYITGIDWGVLGLSSGEGFTNFMTSAAATTINDLIANPGSGAVIDPPTTASVVSASNFAVGYAGNDVQALLTAISGFGTVRALASPRLTVLNNQAAVLNVATNNVYFEIDLDITKETPDTAGSTEIDSTIKSVPEGVLVNVQPSINLENNTIALSVRPTITRIVGTKADPAVAFIAATDPAAANIVSAIPEVNVQEIDTVVQVRSGQPIVMGGLLQDRSSSTREAVPVAGELPVVGSLFRKHNDLVQKSELVIFLKATLLETPEGSIHDTDRDLYKKFSGDRRPLKL